MGTIPRMNRSAKGGARSSLHFRDEGALIHPPHQGVCGRHGTEEQRVTSGELTESPVGIGVALPGPSLLPPATVRERVSAGQFRRPALEPAPALGCSLLARQSLDVSEGEWEGRRVF